ncbi:MAG: hypothetical protein QXX46_04705 [Candidatus Anstonellales archaeon]
MVKMGTQALKEEKRKKDKTPEERRDTIYDAGRKATKPENTMDTLAKNFKGAVEAAAYRTIVEAIAGVKGLSDAIYARKEPAVPFTEVAKNLRDALEGIA